MSQLRNARDNGLHSCDTYLTGHVLWQCYLANGRQPGWDACMDPCITDLIPPVGIPDVCSTLTMEELGFMRDPVTCNDPCGTWRVDGVASSNVGYYGCPPDADRVIEESVETATVVLAAACAAADTDGSQDCLPSADPCETQYAAGWSLNTDYYGCPAEPATVIQAIETLAADAVATGCAILDTDYSGDCAPPADVCPTSTSRDIQGCQTDLEICGQPVATSQDQTANQCLEDLPGVDPCPTTGTRAYIAPCGISVPDVDACQTSDTRAYVAPCGIEVPDADVCQPSDTRAYVAPCGIEVPDVDLCPSTDSRAYLAPCGIQLPEEDVDPCALGQDCEALDLALTQSQTSATHGNGASAHSAPDGVGSQPS